MLIAGTVVSGGWEAVIQDQVTSLVRFTIMAIELRSNKKGEISERFAVQTRDFHIHKDGNGFN